MPFLSTDTTLLHGVRVYGWNDCFLRSINSLEFIGAPSFAPVPHTWASGRLCFLCDFHLVLCVSFYYKTIRPYIFVGFVCFEFERILACEVSLYMCTCHYEHISTFLHTIFNLLYMYAYFCLNCNIFYKYILFSLDIFVRMGACTSSQI
jgi:hypothetical protein